jgi:hypothetical protein
LLKFASNNQIIRTSTETPHLYICTEAGRSSGRSEVRVGRPLVSIRPHLNFSQSNVFVNSTFAKGEFILLSHSSLQAWISAWQRSDTQNIFSMMNFLCIPGVNLLNCFRIRPRWKTNCSESEFQHNTRYALAYVID